MAGGLPTTTAAAGTLVSPAELLMEILNREMIPDVCPAGAVVGPADDEQQGRGVVSIKDAGVNKHDRYVPLLWAREELRCIAGRLSDAERIGRHAFALLQDRGRIVVTQTSTGDRWLVHWTTCVAGPMAAFDGPGTWEMLLYVEMLVGLTPVESAS